MSFLRKLRGKTKATHQAIGDHPFLKRYQTPGLTLVDHYLHLCQLLPIYQALERHLNSAEFSIKDLSGIESLLNRSSAIQRDIDYIQQFLPAGIQPWVSPALNEYVNFINECRDDPVIFGHFLARILGDLFGGQRIKKRLGDLFPGAGLDLSQQSGLTPGIAFYAFEPRTLQVVLNALNEMEKIVVDDDINRIIDAADDGIRRHGPIFDALEQHRAKPKAGVLACNRATLFAAGVGVVTTVAAMVANAYVHRQS